MEHDEAIRLQAAERYVARELSREEQDAFEGHFFDCPDCAEEVRFELTFAANVRAVMRGQASEPQSAPVPAPAASEPGLWEKWRGWFRLRPFIAFSYAANFALAAGCVLLVLTGARQSMAPQFAEFHFAPGAARGGDEVHEIPAGETVYTVHFEFVPNVQSYFYEVLDAAGERESSGTVLAPANPTDNTQLVFPVKGLRSGIHTLEVHARTAGGELVSRSRFRLPGLPGQ